MATRLISMEDVLIEAEVSPNEEEPISYELAEKVSNSFKQIKPIIMKVCRPLKETWDALNKEMTLSQAELEVSFGVEGEGNFYIAKSKASCALSIKLVLKP